MVIFTHPPYLHDLVPSDFELFAKIKSAAYMMYASYPIPNLKDRVAHISRNGMVHTMTLGYIKLSRAIKNVSIILMITLKNKV